MLKLYLNHIRTAVATWVLSADSACLVIYILVCFFLRLIGTGFEVEENRSIFIIKPMPCTSQCVWCYFILPTHPCPSPLLADLSSLIRG